MVPGERAGLTGDPAGDLSGDMTGVMTGDALDRLDDDELAARIGGVRVFARTSPEQKLRIIDAWRATGAIVAMTGDGVHACRPARRADIGVAMGIAGTDVSKEAADMVLADDDFATIVVAVAEGRRIYESIRRFVRYLLTTNSGEVWVMFLAPWFGLPVPLLAIQIRWINLVTDGLPAVALGLEPAEPDSCAAVPAPGPSRSWPADCGSTHCGSGCSIAGVALPLQAAARHAGWPWRTMVFTTVALLQLGHALAVRSEHTPAWRLGGAATRSSSAPSG